MNTRNIQQSIVHLTVTGDAGEIQKGSDEVTRIPSPIPIMVSIHIDTYGWRISVVSVDGAKLPPVEHYSTVVEVLASLTRTWE